MTPKIIIVGTDHFLQCGTGSFSDDQIHTFKSFIEELCSQYQIKSIAEEMYLDALDELGATVTVAAGICHLAEDIGYHCVDLSNKERRIIGIDRGTLASASIKLSVKHHKAIQTRLFNTLDNPVRECCWFARMLEINKWPTLFICGDSHVENMRILIRKVDKNAFVCAYRLGDYLS